VPPKKKLKKKEPELSYLSFGLITTSWCSHSHRVKLQSRKSFQDYSYHPWYQLNLHGSAPSITPGQEWILQCQATEVSWKQGRSQGQNFSVIKPVQFYTYLELIVDQEECSAFQAYKIPQNTDTKGWGHTSEGEHLPSICET
jgi:hypothetical protein